MWCRTRFRRTSGCRMPSGSSAMSTDRGRCWWPWCGTWAGTGGGGVREEPERDLGAPAPTAEELLVAAEEQLRFAGCMGQLAEVQRTVVSLRMIDGLAGADVARALGLSTNHVGVLLHRARAKLATC